MSARGKRGTAVPRVVFDTGVLLAALLRGDAASGSLRQSWQQGRVQALVSPAIAQALMRALACPAFGLHAAQQHELLADFLPYAEVLKPLGKVVAAGLSPSACAALALAAEGQAGLLVSDDRALHTWLGRSRSGLARGMCEWRTAEGFVADF